MPPSMFESFPSVESPPHDDQQAREATGLFV
jgi:hypothetical protein